MPMWSQKVNCCCLWPSCVFGSGCVWAGVPARLSLQRLCVPACVVRIRSSAGGTYKAAEGRKQRKHHLAELKGLLPPGHTPLLVTLLLEQHTLSTQRPAGAAATGAGAANSSRQQMQQGVGFSPAAQQAGRVVCMQVARQQDLAASLGHVVHDWRRHRPEAQHSTAWHDSMCCFPYTPGHS